MARAPIRPRRMSLPTLLLLLLCVFAVLFALSRLSLNFSAQVSTDQPGVKLTVAQQPLATSDAAVAHQKNVNLLRFEARAEQPSGVRLSTVSFNASKGSLANAQNYTLWVDTNGDRMVDTPLKSARAENGVVTFDTDYLLPGAEECETDAHCQNGQACVGCRCAMPTLPLQGQLIQSSPIFVTRKCLDNDGGKNMFTKGVTTNVRMGQQSNLTWNDTCLKDWAGRPSAVPADPMKLLEGFCAPYSVYGQVTYPSMLTCRLGCADGACLESLLRSVTMEQGGKVRFSYAKMFGGCATLRDETNRVLQKGSFFCKMDETVVYDTGFSLSEGLKVKLCRPNGTGCSALVPVKGSAQGSSPSSRSSYDSSWSSSAGPTHYDCRGPNGTMISVPIGQPCPIFSSSSSSSSSAVSSSSSRSSSSIGPTHQDCKGPNGTIISVPIGQPCPVISSASSSVSVSRCTDSDSNAPDQFYTPGFITSNEKTYADDCGGEQLLEWVCSAGYPMSKYFTCPTACIEETGPDGLLRGHCQATCGDGVKEGPSELCDDGNTVNGDGCSATCTPEPVVCGNGRVEAAEQCDIGTACSDGRICEVGTCLCKPAVCVAASSSSSGGCTDTDGGKDYYRFGRFTNLVFGNTVLPNFSDVCFKDNNHNPSIDPNILLEGYCGDDGLGHQEQYRCPFGCEDAVCLPLPASSSASSASLESCAQEGQKVYGSSPFGPTRCCSKNAGIKPSAILAEDMCIAPTDGSLGTCVDNWWLTCGNGTCDAGEDRCNCQKDCSSSVVCGNSKVESGEECDGTGCATGKTCVNCRCLETGSCGNGFVDTARTVVFEVHADMASSFSDPQLQIAFSSLKANNALTGRDLFGLNLNGACNISSGKSCEMVLMTVDSTLFNLHAQGDLYVTLDAQTIPPRQLLAGTLSDSILRVKFHAELEDIDVTDFVLNSSGSMATSVDSLELWMDGATQPFAVSGSCGNADVLTTNAGTLPSVTRAFCFSTENQQLVVPKGSDVKVLVRPRLKSDTTGAMSGDTFALFVDHTAAANDATGTGSVRARGLASSNDLVWNDGDSAAEGEIFIGRSMAAPVNMRIVGNANATVLSKIITIANGGASTGTVPSGADREIGSFLFAAAQNVNTKNGTNQAELTDIVFVVNALNVALDATGFSVINKAGGASQRESCLPFSTDGPWITGTVSGVFLVRCSLPSSSSVNSMIGSGESLTLVLLGNVTNANTAASTGGQSILQVSLNNFSDVRLKEFGLSSTMSHLRWKDRDNAFSTTWTWVQYPDSAVHSTTFRG